MNQSSFEICSAYLSPCLARDWGFDNLAGATIPTGSSFTIRLPGGSYDILMIDCIDEVVTEDYELGTAEDSVYTITDL